MVRRTISGLGNKSMEYQMRPEYSPGSRAFLAVELEARRMRAQVLRAGAASVVRTALRLFRRSSAVGPVVRA